MFMNIYNFRPKGFTLIELLVVIAIIGVLSGIVLSSLSRARNSAKVSAAVSQIKQLEKAIIMYELDTGVYPAGTCMETCTQATDPFSSNLGVFGWRGPYFPVWQAAHPWGGQIGYEGHGDDGSPDVDNDGIDDQFIFLNDDRPGTGLSDNGGAIPLTELLRIDSILDDGNLSTGWVRGNGNGWPNQGVTAGELSIWLINLQ